jgi:hypothetical protein
MLSSLSVTLTNVMSGLVVAFLARAPRHVWQIFKSAIFLSVVGVAIQVQLIPGTRQGIYFIPDFSDDARWVSGGTQDPFYRRCLLVLFTGVVLPRISVKEMGFPGFPRIGLSVQDVSYPVVGIIGITIWCTLLSLAAYAPIEGGQLDGKKLYTAVGLVALGQIVLHTLWGREIFLYSAHFVPVLILFSAYACRTRFRKVAVALAVALLVIEIANNVPAFLWSANYVRTLAAAG